MPNENKPTPPPANAIAHNKEVASKLANQDISGQSTAADPTDADSALDNLMKVAEEKAKAKSEADENTPAIEPKSDGQPQGEVETVVEPTTDDTSSQTPPENQTPPPEPTPEQVEAKKLADDIFKDAPSLPAGASPKSAEAFATIKVKAAQEISSLRKQTEDLSKQVEDLTAKLKNPIPDEVSRELTDLRSFRAKIDIELDPKFKEHDRAVEQAREFIYAQLRKSPAVDDTVIAEIKKHGGPDNVKLHKIFDAIKDPTIQRLVESKVADIEQHKFNKDQAIRSAKENLSQYLTDREKQVRESATNHNRETKAQLDPLVANLAWFKERKAPAGADDATKKSIDDHNKFVTQTRAQLADAVNDDSPEMRAVLITAALQLFNLQREHAAEKTRAATLEKENGELKALVDRLKVPTKSRLPQSSAPANVPEHKPKTDYNTPTGDALDSIAKQVMQERERAKANA